MYSEGETLTSEFWIAHATFDWLIESETLAVIKRQKQRFCERLLHKKTRISDFSLCPFQLLYNYGKDYWLTSTICA